MALFRVEFKSGNARDVPAGDFGDAENMVSVWVDDGDYIVSITRVETKGKTQISDERLPSKENQAPH